MNADRERDRLLENALTRELRAGDLTPASASCLDAETLAAWIDGGLDAPSIAMAQAHAADCTRCQALLGTAIKTAPAVPAAETHGARLWRWWLAPVAATAAAATLWMVIPQETILPTASAPTVSMPTTQSAPAESGAAPSAPSELPPPAATDRLTLGKDRADAAPPARSATERQRNAQAFEAREQKAEAPKRAESVAEGRMAAAAPPATVMREQVGVMADAQVTARSSPTPDVIWLVGRAGMVQLATDGRTFVRLPFPEAVDLAAVTATDGRHAMVTTADGRPFETADAGRTWRLRR